MNSSLDLNLQLLTRQAVRETSEPPDLYADAPPRRVARGRESDSLVIYFSMTGNSPLTVRDQTQLLVQLASKFYKTSGSATAALRALAESLNLQLLDRNLRSTSTGRQGIGQLILAAWRQDVLYLAQCGAIQAYAITTAGTQPLYDQLTSGRGLGLSRSLPLRFVQIKLAVDDYLVLSTIPSTAWPNVQFNHPSSQGIDEVNRQVSESAGADFNALIIQATAGTGKLKVLRHKAFDSWMTQPDTTDRTTAVELTQEAPAPVVGETMRAAQSVDISTAQQPVTEMVEPVSPQVESSIDIDTTPAGETIEEPGNQEVPGVQLDTASGVETVTPPEQAVEADLSAPPAAPLAYPPSEQPVTEGERIDTTPSAPPANIQISDVERTIQPAGATNVTAATSNQAATASQPAPQAVKPAPKRPSAPRLWAKYLVALQQALLKIGTPLMRATRSALGTIASALLKLLKSLLPDADVLRLPPSTMVFIAVAIPLILAVLGGMVFLQRGQAQQQQTYYDQAVEKATYADSLSNPLEQRLALQTALGELDKADQFIVTSQSQQLRSQLTTRLDALDSVKRLDYKQAIVGGLASTVKVTRIVASTADLYLLDATSGNVLHAVMTARGYELDPTFQCGPTNGPVIVGPLVDIAELPPGAYENATVLGIDANGNLLYCVVGSAPYSATLAPPNTGLGQPIGISLDRGDLFVLDPQVNAVWMYTNMEVSQPPHLFFGDVIPPMRDVIDMVVYNDDLYLLHTDGHTTKCTYSGMVQSPTRCDDPFPYSDNRPGRSHGPVLEDAIFSQISYATFPERSIFYLDPKDQAIFYFSVLLTLQYQYQPKTTLAAGDATGFAISPNRIAFLAVGNNVFYAAMP